MPSGSSPADPSFRCAVASESRGDDLAGTASTVRAFLLVEHPGPWGVDALRDARLPDGLGEQVRRAAAAARVRVLLIRRPVRARESGAAPSRIFAAYADASVPWLESGSTHDLADVLDLDLDALRAGRSSGLTPHTSPIFCVCTHGRHDACCAERGRPVAASLSASHPDQTWEVSHIGGDRFAGNMLVLPEGLYYGRLTPESAPVVADAHLAGALDLDHLRGRSGVAMPVQAAEIALRRRLDETRDDAVRLVRATREGELVAATFDAGGTTYTVRVAIVEGPDDRLTCRSESDHPPIGYRVLEA